MKIETKANIVSITTFLIIYTLSWVSIFLIFDRVSILMVSAISLGLTVLLLPQQKIVEAPNGNYIKIKWAFLKKSTIIK